METNSWPPVEKKYLSPHTSLFRSTFSAKTDETNDPFTTASPFLDQGYEQSVEAPTWNHPNSFESTYGIHLSEEVATVEFQMWCLDSIDFEEQDM